MCRRFVLSFLLFLSLSAAAPLQTPEQFAGFRMGTDKKLLRWDRIVEYMKQAAASSPRIKLDELGKSTNGNPFIAVTIASPETLKDLARYKETQRRIAYPRGLAPDAAEKLISSQKAVFLITCNIHATEIGSTQMVPELVHRLATEDSPFILNILDNVIFILVPSLNPDGQILVTDWYAKNAGTEWESSPLPELYHKYTGHDNNRDGFMNTQIESKLINKLTYRDWFPVVSLDEHQMGNAGPRIFVPPFKNPINPNIDPMIWEENGMLGYAMGAALHAKGYTGIVNDTMYTSWWQGGFVMQNWWHNMVGLLTEVASVNIASPVEQEKFVSGRSAAAGPEPTIEQQRGRDPRRPVPAPRDVERRNTYPRPWMGGAWKLRDIVDYELAATYGVLDSVARNREMLIRNFYLMNRRQIEAGEKESPYAWVVPAAQHDPAAATRLLQILDEEGGEVHRAQESFTVSGKTYPAGSHVVLMAQPFRPFLKDLLEKQIYPATRVSPGGPVERPYDVAGWTLPLQMGVEAVEIKQRFEAKLTLESPVVLPSGKVEMTGGNVIAWEIPRNSNNAFIAANRLLKAGVNVRWSNSGEYVAFSREDLSSRMKQWSAELGLEVRARTSLPTGARTMKSPRTALYMPWSANMDEGWTRWLLEQYEFPYTSVRNAGVKSGRLRDRFDVFILADQPKESILRGLSGDWVRPEHRGGIGEEGVAALREFVRAGGTLITLGSSSLVAIEEFPLPLKNSLKGLRQEQFFCPGSILKIFVDNTHPVAAGMREQASAVFYNDVAFDLAPGLGDAAVKVIARYPSSGMLESGWIGGEEYLQDRIAAAEVTMGKGRVVLLGFSPQNRAQPHGTFKLLFNAVHLGGVE